MAHTMNRDQFQRWQALNGKVQAFYKGSPTYAACPSQEEWAEYEALRRMLLPPQNPAERTLVTYSIGSDRYPGTVFLVVQSGREIWAEIKGLGMMKFTYRPSEGVYREKGLPCGRLHVGVAEEYYDPSF